MEGDRNSGWVLCAEAIVLGILSLIPEGPTIISELTTLSTLVHEVPTRRYLTEPTRNPERLTVPFRLTLTRCTHLYQPNTKFTVMDIVNNSKNPHRLEIRINLNRLWVP